MSRIDDVCGNYADMKNISLEKGSLFEKSAEVGLSYISSIDIDRLLAPSYEVHGAVPPNNAVRYGGWERKGANNWTSSGGSSTYTLAGHSLGHWLSAAAVFYRETGDEKILEKLNYAVERLYELQQQTGSGYIGGCEEKTFVRCFSGDENWADGYWVPWYGIHKIYQGLLDAYDYTGDPTAFIVLKRFTDWAVDGTEKLTYPQLQRVLDVEYGGMNEIFARMYEITGCKKYLDTAVRFTHAAVIDPLIKGEDRLTGLHANTQIPKIIGAAEIYEQAPETYSSYRIASENFWRFVNNDRSYAIGGNSISEHFEAEGAETLGVKTCESCNTYNMMRLTEHLFSWEQDSQYMDWYEKALYNHILGQQDPKTGEKMYFVSLLQGHHRVYEVKENSWWCCTGTGMENPGRYTRAAYYEHKDDLYVNLYMPGTFTWAPKGLSFKVETDYPYSNRVKIIVTDGAASANIKLRAPGWLESPMKVTAHGEKYASSGGEYLNIPGTWTKGDIIELVMPMSVMVYRSRNTAQIAYEYGPVVLAAELGSVKGISGVCENISNETIIDTVTAEAAYIITKGKEPADILKPVDISELRFKISGKYNSAGRDIMLRPFYEIHHSFYNVYWDLDSSGNEYEKLLNRITIDKVEPDGQQDEIGHELASNDSKQGSFAIGTESYFYRDVYGRDSSYFQYTMKVNSEKTNHLFIRCWSGDTEDDNVQCTCDIDVCVDGKPIGSQTGCKAERSLCDVFYEIPIDITQGKTAVAVKFTLGAAPGRLGRIIQIRTTTENIQIEK